MLHSQHHEERDQFLQAQGKASQAPVAGITQMKGQGKHQRDSLREGRPALLYNSLDVQTYWHRHMWHSINSVLLSAKS